MLHITLACRTFDTRVAQVLGDMPQKSFEFTRRTEATAALDLSAAGSPQEALDKVL